jgi:hypothetical protein
VKQEIMQRYNRHPQGWQVWLGKDARGFLDVFIFHGNEFWQIKEFQVNPYRVVGYGGSIATDQPLPLHSSRYQFGLRPIDESRMKELARCIDDPRSMADLISKLLRIRPVPTEEAMSSPVILQGPVMQLSRGLDTISESQKELDRKLGYQLQKLVMRKYRHTLTPYI